MFQVSHCYSKQALKTGPAPLLHVYNASTFSCYVVMNFSTVAASSPQIPKYLPLLQKSGFAPQTPLAKAGLSNIIDAVTKSKVVHSLPVPVPCLAAWRKQNLFLITLV